MMLRYVYDHPDEVAFFVAQLIPHCRERGFGKSRAIGVVDEDGRLIAGVVYHDFVPETGVMSMSAAAITPRWLTRETVQRIHEFPFDGAGCQMVLQVVPAEHERLLRQLAAGGYMMVRVPRLFGRDRDGIACMFTDDDWRASKFNRRRAELREAA